MSIVIHCTYKYNNDIFVIFIIFSAMLSLKGFRQLLKYFLNSSHNIVAIVTCIVLEAIGRLFTMCMYSGYELTIKN